MAHDDTNAIFVYGTLKRGEEREPMWPHLPIKVVPATTQAALFDLGPYPALGEGSDTVAGELWFVDAKHLAQTLAALDEIEGYGQDGPDLYLRRTVNCQDDNGDRVLAQSYFYADEESLEKFARVCPNAQGVCRWSAGRR